MLGKDVSKSEIEEELIGKGEFVQIDYLSKLLKERLHRDTKKFVCLKLAEIYEKKNMFSDAAKMFEHIAMISIAFSEKIKNFVKEAELYIKAGFFDMADYAMKKALSEANASEKAEIYFAIKDFYKRQAQAYERELRRNHALKIYEKLLEMNISELERKEIKEKILGLYEKLGRLKEYFAMKKFEEKEF